ncbi:NADH oxidase [subsurface metagenome]
MARDFEKLLSPGIIGRMKIGNRIVMPPMVRNYATPDGIATRQLIDHYIARARGGVGLIIVEAAYIHPAGKGWQRQLGIYDDKCIAGLNDLAEAIKEWGCRAAIQIIHCGRQTDTSTTGMPVVAPSAIPCPTLGGFPKELTTEEVAELVETFVQAAARAKQARFDAVEIHGAHGYIVSQFLSPLTNRRTDKYGGDLSGRMTFALEIVQRAKEVVGNDFPIIMRMNATDLVDGGLEISESKEIARKLQAVGVDALHITAGIYEATLNPRMTSVSGLASLYAPGGQLVDYAEQIKKVVSLPVITVGAITPDMGEEILQQGKADFIAMGRALLADPELAKKLARGEPENIRPCIRCNDMCIERQLYGLGIRCSVNAEVGFESYEIRPAQRRKRVLIAGGGPAGMEAARVLASRGHDVTLYEKNRELGGHLVEATVPVFKEDLRNYKDWLIGQIKKLGVKVELGKEVTSQIVDDVKLDALIIATGSIAYCPDVSGIDKPMVTTAIDILLGKTEAGNKTIVGGGGFIGCEVAWHLAQQGKKVIIVEMLPEIAIDVPERAKGALITGLIDSGVEMLTNLRITEVTDNGVIAIDHGQKLVSVEGDKVVLAMGLVSQTKLYEELKSKVNEVYLIGDCVEARKVGEATRDGYRIGNSL